MKVQSIRISEIARTDLIVLIESDGAWSVITTIEKVQAYEAPYAVMDETGMILRDDKIIGMEEDVSFVGGPYDVVFDFRDVK